MEKVLPEWIGKDDDGFRMISIPGRGTEAMLVESIRTLKTQNDELQARVRALERERTVSSLLASNSLAVTAALFLPLGLVVAFRTRKRRPN